MADLFDLATAFGSAAPHTWCCDCCDGYCPLFDEGDDRWTGNLMYVYTADDGTEYLTLANVEFAAKAKPRGHTSVTVELLPDLAAQIRRGKKNGKKPVS